MSYEKNGPIRAHIEYCDRLPFAEWRGSERIELELGKALEITFEGFPAGSNLKLVDLVHAHKPLLIRFRPDECEIPSTIFSFELSGESLDDQRLVIHSRQKPRKTQVHYLEMSGFVGGGLRVWKMDPEVVNRPGSIDLPDRDEKRRIER